MTKTAKQQAREIKEYFQRGYNATNPPASRAEITRFEHKFNVQFPPILRELYLLCNGFRGPSDAPYLGALFGEPWSAENFMRLLAGDESGDLKNLIAFGQDTAFHMFAMQGAPSRSTRIVSLDPEAGVVECGDNLFAAYLRDEKLYKESREP